MNKVYCKNCKYDGNITRWAGVWATYAEIATGCEFMECKKKATEFKVEILET